MSHPSFGSEINSNSLFQKECADCKPLDIFSPKKQHEKGIPIEEIKCRTGFSLILKINDSPACVSPKTSLKLEQYGWGQIITDASYYTLQKNNLVGISTSDFTFDAGSKMTYVSVSDDNHLLLASSSEENLVYAFDVKNSELLKKIPVGVTPKGLKIHPELKIAFVANEGSGSISIIDVHQLSVMKEIEVGKMPHNIAFDNNTAFVTLQGEDNLALIDVNSLELKQKVSAGKLPHNLDLAHDKQLLLVTNIGTNDVSVFDINSLKVISTIPVTLGHHGIDVSPDENYAYVSGIGSDKVTAIDLSTISKRGELLVGNGPHGLRTNLDNSKLYVAVLGTNEVVVIDTKEFSIIDRIEAESGPFWISIPGNS